MDKNTITILSPGPNCWKTKKIIASISNLKEFAKYKIWILPTIIINDKIVARGYRPSNEKIITNLE